MGWVDREFAMYIVFFRIGNLRVWGICPDILDGEFAKVGNFPRLGKFPTLPCHSEES